MGLAEHLATRATVDPREVEAWSVSAEGKEFVRRSSDDWCRASIAAGTPQAAATGTDDGLLHGRGWRGSGRGSDRGLMHAFDVLGDPVRRRILELLAKGEHTSGAIVAVVQRELGISQPAVSQHLKVLRENGSASVRVDGPRRLYSVESTSLREVDAWLERFRGFWAQRLDALATEVARGKRKRRR